jgi:hypothetical protein
MVDETPEITAEDKTDEEIDELIEKFEEIKEEKERSLSPVDVVDRIPEHASWNGNKLKVNIENRTWNTSGQKRMSLTSKSKKILRALNDGKSASQIDREGVASQSYAGKVKRAFGFLLSDPMLFDAFVARALKSSREYKVEGPDDKFTVEKESLPSALEAAERFVESTGESPVIRHPDGHTEVYETQEQKAASFDSDQSISPLDEEDWKHIIAALHRDDQDELASFVLDEVM